MIKITLVFASLLAVSTVQAADLRLMTNEQIVDRIVRGIRMDMKLLKKRKPKVSWNRAMAQAQERKHLQPGFSQDWQGLPSRHFDGSKIPEYKPLRTRQPREANFRNV